MISYEDFQKNFQKLNQDIKTTCKLYNLNPNNIKILPITKNMPNLAIEYINKIGLCSIGESKVQEALLKKLSCNIKCNYELIGHLQNNKVKKAIKIFDIIHSADNIKLLTNINHQAQCINRIMPCFIQINMTSDINRFGFLVKDIDSIFEKIIFFKNIKIQGLMTILPINKDIIFSKKLFFKLKNIKDYLENKFKINLPELSMGTSSDFKEAISAGSTVIRIGSKLFK